MSTAPLSKIREAREALSAKALDLFNLYVKNATAAMEAGDFETAGTNLRWLLEHMPKGSDGQLMLEPSVDKPKQLESVKGPQINIGFALGGVNQPKALPAIDVEVVDKEDDE